MNAAFPASGPAPARRLVIHAMQASGASIFALWLAQRRDCVALVDVPFSLVTPHLPTHRPALAKTVITTAYALAEHVDRFGADRTTVLFLRDPHDVWRSLSRKGYRDENGLIEEKMALYDAAFARARQGRDYDAMVAYEDLMADRPAVAAAMTGLGWPADESHDAFPRSQNDLLAALNEAAPDVFRRHVFGFGDARPGGFQAPGDRPRDPEAEARATALCPRLTDFYRTRTGMPAPAAGAV